MFKEPTDRWTKLASAVHYKAIRASEMSTIGSVPLPSEKGSTDRLVAAARAAVKAMTNAYAGYYMGVADVGMAMADVAKEMKRSRTSEMLKEASYLWVLRARALRGTNITLIAKNKPTPSTNHMRVPSTTCDLLLVPAPYRAYKAYQKHVGDSTLLPRRYKTHIARDTQGALSDVFMDWGEQIYPVKKTTLTRYLNCARELGQDMEEAWKMLTEDMYQVVSIYGPSERERSPSPTHKKPKVVSNDEIAIPLGQEASDMLGYWDVIAAMDADEVDWVEDFLERMGGAFEDTFCERMFSSVEEMREILREMDFQNPLPPPAGHENVR